MQEQIDECGMAEEINEESTALEEGTAEEGTVEGTVEEGTVSNEFDRRFQITGCQYVTVYVESGNAIGNQYTNSGNITPQVIRTSFYFPFSCEFSAH